MGITNHNVGLINIIRDNYLITVIMKSTKV